MTAWVMALQGLTPEEKKELSYSMMNCRLSSVRYSHRCAMENEEEFRRSGYYLRNLTTRQIMQVCICKGCEQAHVGPLPKAQQLQLHDSIFKLDDIIVFLTRWSTPPYGTQQTSAEILLPWHVDHQGPWAGHSFDIVSLEDHIAECLSDSFLVQHVGDDFAPLESSPSQHEYGWEDVTEKVLRKIVEAYMHAATRTEQNTTRWPKPRSKPESFSFVSNVRFPLRFHRGHSHTPSPPKPVAFSKKTSSKTKKWCAERTEGLLRKLTLKPRTTP